MNNNNKDTNKDIKVIIKNTFAIKLKFVILQQTLIIILQQAFPIAIEKNDEKNEKCPLI